MNRSTWSTRQGVLRRAAASMTVAVIFVVAILSLSWFFGGPFVALLKPGEYAGRVLKRLGVGGTANFAAAMFVFMNVMFWFFVVFAASALVASRLRARR